jgi:hypothetical protein
MATKIATISKVLSTFGRMPPDMRSDVRASADKSDVVVAMIQHTSLGKEDTIRSPVDELPLQSMYRACQHRSSEVGGYYMAATISPEFRKLLEG